jgi:phosphoglycerate kinase
VLPSGPPQGRFLQPSASGFLLAKELKHLDGAIQNGEKPMAAIVDFH